MKKLSFFSQEGILWKFTTALAPWQGRFYERLVGLVKQSLRRGMGRKLLHWDKLLTMLTEVEAIINTRALTYVYDDFLTGFTLTPAHFLTGDLDIALPSSSDDCDIEYLPMINFLHEKRSKICHAYRVNYWKKLDETWHVGGVTIIEVPFCGLKGIHKRPWRYDTKPNRCQNYAVEFVPPSYTPIVLTLWLLFRFFSTTARSFYDDYFNYRAIFSSLLL